MHPMMSDEARNSRKDENAMEIPLSVVKEHLPKS